MVYTLVLGISKEIEGIDDYDEVVDHNKTTFKINSNTKLCTKTHDCTLKISNMKNDLYASSTGRKTSELEISGQNGGIVIIDLYREIYLTGCKNAVFNILDMDYLKLNVKNCENIKLILHSNTKMKLNAEDCENIEFVLDPTTIRIFDSYKVSFELNDVDLDLNDDIQNFKNKYIDM